MQNLSLLENLIIKLKKNLRYIFYCYIFFESIYFIYNIGASYDIAGFRNGAGIVLKKIALNFQNRDSIYLLEFSFVDYFGSVLPVASYVFGHAARIFFGKYFLKNNIFLNEDDIVYSFIYIFLLFYFIILIEVIYRQLKRFINPNASFIFVILLYFIPSISGQHIFNIKDIPYAMHLFIAFLSYLSFINNKNLKYYNIEVFVTFLMVLLIRVNGLIFLSLLVLIVNYQNISLFFIKKEFYLYHLKLFIKLILSLFILSPSSWRYPVIWLKKTLNHQLFHDWDGYTLTNGNFVYSKNVSIDYLLEWIFYRLPMFYILLIIFSILMELKNRQRSNKIFNASISFLVAFTILFIIFKPTAYDGDRQYLFLYPFILSLCTTQIDRITILKNKYILLSAIFMIFYFSFSYYTLGSFRYIYLNEFVDSKNLSNYCYKNIDGCGNWSSDYQAISGKKLAKTINNNFTNQKILVCRPEHSVALYLNTNLNDVYEVRNFQDINLTSFYVATFHRPRINLDSCNNFLSMEYSCYKINSNFVYLRGNQVSLNYLSFCEKFTN